MSANRRVRIGGGLVVLLAVAGAAIAQPAPAPAPPGADWIVSSPGAVVSREVRFKVHGAELVGTLTLPARGTRLPTVVVTHGAEAPTREYAMYAHLRDSLPGLGYAVFVYDRRGSGASSGDIALTDYTILADDAVAAARAIVAAEPRLDPRGVGYWGLSQGGWLAVLAASRDPRAAFAVSVSGPLTTPAEQMNFAVGNLLATRGYARPAIDQALRTRGLVDDFLRGRADRPTVQAALDAAAPQPWFRDAFLQPRLSEHPADSRWRKEMDYDPVAPLAALRIPVLLIFGGADPWIPVQASLQRLARLTPTHPNIAVRVVAGADHTMMDPQADPMAYDKATLLGEAPNRPDYFLQLGAWLARRRRD